MYSGWWAILGSNSNSEGVDPFEVVESVGVGAVQDPVQMPVDLMEVVRRWSRLLPKIRQEIVEAARDSDVN